MANAPCLNVAPWTDIISPNEPLNGGSFAELVMGGWDCTFLPNIIIVGVNHPQRYAVLSVRDETILCVTLWTNQGGQQGHTIEFPLTLYNKANGPDELEEELRVVFRLWGFSPQQRQPLRSMNRTGS